MRRGGDNDWLGQQLHRKDHNKHARHPIPAHSPRREPRLRALSRCVYAAVSPVPRGVSWCGDVNTIVNTGSADLVGPLDSKT